MPCAYRVYVACVTSHCVEYRKSKSAHVGEFLLNTLKLTACLAALERRTGDVAEQNRSHLLLSTNMSRLMNTRKISNDVYAQIKATGTLGGLRGRVFDYVLTYGPVTIAEAIQDIGGKRDSSINARFSELRKLGLIKQVDTVPDPTGGTHKISQWDVTGETPVLPASPRRTVWHVMFWRSVDPGIKAVRVEYSRESALAYAESVGDRLIEIIQFKEVIVQDRKGPVAQ